jgi:hypothetical protein
MSSTRSLIRNVSLAFAVVMMLASSAFAQRANRMVEGTVSSVIHARNGDHVRLTDGMDLLVPNTITGMNAGRRYTAAMLQPGDVVRMAVYSRQGDGRDAQVRSLEIVSIGGGRGYNNNNGYDNDGWVNGTNGRRLNGTIVSVDRRARTLVMQTDRGRTVSVNFTGFNRNGNFGFRKGDRISVSGRMDRGLVIADDVRTERR